jgi:hypothetical protein
MGTLQEMRASDSDRQQAVERLRGGLEDGRLSMAEYLDRMEGACQAVTYGDLAPLFADLPTPAGEPGSPARPRTAPSRPARTSRLAGLPMTLKVLWTLWLSAVSINVVVWILVSGTGGGLAYPWPLWVAGPWGALLFAASAGISLFRRNGKHNQIS